MTNRTDIIIILLVLFIAFVLNGCGVNYEVEQFHSAVCGRGRTGNIEPLDEAKLMLAKNPKLLNAKDSYGSTPLHTALHCVTFKLDIVKFLIAAGADVNAKAHVNTEDGRHETPLHIVLRYGRLPPDELRLELIELLIANGADINAKTKQRPVFGGCETPLYMAAANHSREIIEFLITNGADVNVKNGLGQTPLCMAVFRRDIGIVTLLIENGAEIKERDESGRTPLHFAASGGNNAAVELLIANGADVNAKTHHGITPLQVALNKEYNDIADLLRKHGSSEK